MTASSDSSARVEQVPPDASSDPRPWHKSRRGRWIAIAGGLLLFILGIWLAMTKLPRWLTTPETTAPAASATAGSEARRIQAVLFHVAEDGTSLVGATVAVPYGSTTVDQLRYLVDAQVRPATGSAHSAVPEGTTVRAVFVTGDHEAYVDLGGAIVTGQSGGSQNEALTVYAIVNAITVNLPDITAVQILVNGKEVDSLAGHIDLRHPLTKALDWITKDTH